MLTLDNHFSSTYSKLLLNNWKTLSECIYKETVWIKDTLQPKSDTTYLLSDQQINDALNGPFQAFFKPLFNAHAAISKLEAAINLSKEDFFKESEQTSDMTLGFSKQAIAQADITALKALHVRLDEITTECHAQWESNIKSWSDSLLSEFKKINLDLSEIELHDFTTNEPVSELNDRFVNLKIPAPKLPKSDFNFSQYFTAKATIAIHSALNRMQQPNTEKNIQEQLKNLAPILKSISKTEKELAEMHQKIIKQVIETIQK
ncbi:MAG: hypothetical protein COY58_09670 [Gammaproteobacteria bacterium CG_4_10_14_0_8_um_filter_38_16]|nr:MAG: hypothetical protein COY58_09670 [Gammaproteobacteria bacterium CG_4_10_14_0_8_um_filter_38_16]PJA03049.1 MAG: hypothetical protein COX72_06995 [Gammaproteobacteria bacterium CG_4_10_14_0_2_um_filter_38_22]PJB10221.1 MAG: hypothetical protein CO120_05920 [Gammaproteobacteria bacterium CG_4_9_14_3_um_filter_38_9]